MERKKKRKTDNAWENGELSSEDKKKLARKNLLTCFMGAQVPVKQYQLPLSLSPAPSAPSSQGLVMSLIGD